MKSTVDLTAAVDGEDITEVLVHTDLLGELSLKRSSLDLLKEALGIGTTAETIAIPADYSTLQDALDSLDGKTPAGTVTIEVTGRISASYSSQIALVTNPYAGKIILRGARSVLTKTIQSSGHSVTSTVTGASLTGWDGSGVAAGSGYTPGTHTATIVGGTGTAATLSVVVPATGIPSSVSVLTGGSYTTQPPRPCTVTGVPGGTGLSINLEFSPYTITLELDNVTNVEAGNVVRVYAPTNLDNDFMWMIDFDRSVALGFMTTSGVALYINPTYAAVGAPIMSTDYLVAANGESREVVGQGVTVTGVAINGAGSGYTNGTYVVTVSGGTFQTAATLVVTVSGGAVTAVTRVQNTAGDCGYYTTAPSNPVSVTGLLGGGSGASFDLTTTATSKIWELASGFTQDLAAQAYGYRIKKAAGTIGTGGSPSTTVTGSSTDFTSRCTVGDLLFCNGEFRRITAIASDTDITVSHNITIANGTVFGVYTLHEAHVGAFEITSVDSGGSTITYTNKVLYPLTSLRPTPFMQLGANQLKGGNVEILRDGFKNTHASGNGIVFQGPAGFRLIDKLYLIGGGGTVGDAISASASANLDGVDTATYTGLANGPAAATYIRTGPQVGICDWGQAVKAQAGSASLQYLCAGNIRGDFALFLHQAPMYIDHARISGFSVFGAFIGPGAGLRYTGAIFAGQEIAAVYNNGGGGEYADGPRAYGTNANGFQGISGGSGHAVEARALSCRLIGVARTSGGNLRFAGCLSAGCATGISIENTKAESHYGWASGNTQNVIVAYGTLDFGDATSTGSDGVGVFSIDGANVDFERGFATRNNGGGIQAASSGRINATTCWADDNTGSDIAVSAQRAIIVATGAKGTPVYSHPVNTKVLGDSEIIDTGATGYASRKSVTVLHTTVSLNFGSISAGGEATLTATLSGAAAGDVGRAVPVGTFLTGLDFDLRGTADNEVTVRAKNYSTGSQNPADTTFALIIERFN